MRFVAFILVFMPIAAIAQTAQQPVPQASPQEEAYQQEIGQLEVAKLNWETQAITEKRIAEDLQKQLDAMKKAPPATK